MERAKEWWNANTVIAKKIATLVGELVNHQHGYPSSLSKEFKTEEECVAKWNEILVTIRDGFTWYYKSGDTYIWKDGKEPPAREYIKNPDGSFTMAPIPPGYKLVLDRKNLKLFAKAKRYLVKYFDSLWD